MAYVFGSIWDRFNRNALNDLSKSVEQQGKSIQDLVAEGQLTPEQYATLIQSVNGLISKGEVKLEDIDKESFKLDQTYLSDELLKQIAGTAEINAVPAKGSIRLEQTTFAEVVSKNLNNKNETFSGSVNVDTGEVYEVTGFKTSDFIKVSQGDTVYTSHVFGRYAFYNGNKEYVSGQTILEQTKKLEIPAGVQYVRITYLTTYQDIFTISINEALTAYEPFKMGIPVDLVLGNIMSNENESWVV